MGQTSGSVFTPAQGRTGLCRAPRHMQRVRYWETFSLLICKTEKLVFMFSDKDTIFRENFLAFSWGGAGGGRELTLNDTTKYAFSVNVFELSV